jgi:hypothetical protein
MQLPEYLSATFPGLDLDFNLFRVWPVALRFEVGLGRPKDSTYFEVAVNRACTLYESAFAPSDLCFLVSDVGHFEKKGRKSTNGYSRRLRPSVRNIFELSRRNSLGLGGISGRQRISHYEGDGEFLIFTRRWATISPCRIDFRFILQALAHWDFPDRSPYIHDRIYFINRTRNLIFHMYDDRGLDIISPQVDNLRDLYETHNDWILDYNREEINKTFSTPT